MFADGSRWSAGFSTSLLFLEEDISHFPDAFPGLLS
jgi:hypothetical protein